MVSKSFQLWLLSSMIQFPEFQLIAAQLSPTSWMVQMKNLLFQTFKLFLRSLAFIWNKEFQSRKKTPLLPLQRLLSSLRKSSIHISQRLLIYFLSASILTLNQSTSNSEPRSSKPSLWSQAQFLRKYSFCKLTKSFNQWYSFKNNRWTITILKDPTFYPPGKESASSWRKNSLLTWMKSFLQSWPRLDSRLRWRLRDKMEVTILKVFSRKLEPPPVPKLPNKASWPTKSKKKTAQSKCSSYSLNSWDQVLPSTSNKSVRFSSDSPNSTPVTTLESLVVVPFQVWSNPQRKTCQTTLPDSTRCPRCSATTLLKPWTLKLRQNALSPSLRLSRRSLKRLATISSNRIASTNSQQRYLSSWSNLKTELKTTTNTKKRTWMVRKKINLMKRISLFWRKKTRARTSFRFNLLRFWVSCSRPIKSSAETLFTS